VTTLPTTNRPEAAEQDRYVFLERPRCPKCGGADLQTIRSQRHPDGTVERRTQCRLCFHRFFVVWE